jgi:hypothetical protein
VRRFSGHQALRTARSALRTAKPVSAAERLERAQALDRPVGALSELVVRVLPPGPRTDALHGVPFGQPAFETRVSDSGQVQVRPAAASGRAAVSAAGA